MKPPFRHVWRYTERPLLEFPPTIAGGKLYFVNNSGLRDRARRRHRQAALEAADRPPQRLLARLLQAPPLHRQPRPRPRGQARRAAPAGCCGNTLLPGRAESSPVVVGAQPLLRLRRRQSLLAQHPQRPRALGDRAGWAGQVGARLLRRRPLRRRLRRLHERGRAPRAASCSGRAARSARASAPRAPSTRPPLSPSAASTPATTTPASTASTVTTARSPGPTRPAATSTRGRPSPAPPTPAPPSTSAPSTATSTRSTRRTACRAGSVPPAAR